MSLTNILDNLSKFEKLFPIASASKLRGINFFVIFVKYTNSKRLYPKLKNPEITKLNNS